MGLPVAIVEALTELDHAVGAFRTKVSTHLHELFGEATADGTQLLHDAEAAAAPLVDEAKQDVEQLGAHAAADVADVLGTGTGTANPQPAVDAPAPAADQAPTPTTPTA